MLVLHAVRIQLRSHLNEVNKHVRSRVSVFV